MLFFAPKGLELVIPDCVEEALYRSSVPAPPSQESLETCHFLTCTVLSLLCHSGWRHFATTGPTVVVSILKAPC